MQFYLKRWGFISLGFFVFWVASFSASAEGEKANPIHWTATKTTCDRKKNQCQLVGNAALHQKNESLYGDFISVDMNTRLVHAQGHVVFVGEVALILAEEMNYNLDTGTGSISKGRVSNDHFSLTGDRINKLGPGRFQTHRGEYSTCMDCPRSWSLYADDVDLEIDGYAYMNRVVTKINDTPALWLPYLVIPIKSRRQTGFLVPRFVVVPQLGFSFVQPFFWATSRSTDMTFGLGKTAGRGTRAEWEGRYNFFQGQAQVNYFRTRDKSFHELLDKGGWTTSNKYSLDRWALIARQKHQLPWGIKERLRIADVSDSFYPSILAQDLRAGDSDSNLYGSASLPSTLIFSKNTDSLSSSVTFRRYRNLLTRSDDTNPVQDPREFDGATVQEAPQVLLNSYPKPLFGTEVYGSLGLTVAHFTRSQDFYDIDQSDLDRVNLSRNYIPGVDPIREGTRISLQPSLSRSYRLFDIVEGTTSTNYHQYFYRFGNPQVPSLNRGYLQLQFDLSTQLERSYEVDNKILPRVKHLIRPLFRYSVIPYRDSPNHPFVQQINYADNKNFTGYQFDNEDIVPLDSNFTNANYFAPQGNAISYGLNSALVRKRVSGPSSNFVRYERFIDLNLGQSINFRELHRSSSDQRPLSRFFSNLEYEFDKFGGYTDYYYAPYIEILTGRASRHVFSTSVHYSFDGASSSRLLSFQRRIGLGYSHNRSPSGSQAESLAGNLIFSLNDYVMPQITTSYNFLTRRLQAVDSKLTYGSPSQCWQIAVSHHYIPANICGESGSKCSSFEFQWGINLDGNSFGGIPEGSQ